MVHGVMDTEQPTSWIPLRPQLSRRALDRGLRILSRYYRFVSLTDAIAMLTGRKPVQPYSLVLTFDDGYRNNLTHAVPILRRYHAPAALFVTTGHVDQHKPFWFDRLDYVLQHADVAGRQIHIGPTTLILDAHDRASLRASYKQLRDVAKALNRPDREMAQEMEDLAASLEKECGHKLADICTNDPWSAVLTWNDMQGLQADDIIIGSHTVGHVRLGLVDDQTAREQMLQSKRAIEDQLGQPCRYLCYPSGSFTHQTVALARDCGYEAALTTEEGTNQTGDNLMLLRRISFPETDNTMQMLSIVSGLTAFVSSWVVRLRNIIPCIKMYALNGIRAGQIRERIRVR